ncbi:hypothetical protein CC85DRAFT_325882, partial [Cutaneotrichosporon oleaginosum]
HLSSSLILSHLHTPSSLAIYTRYLYSPFPLSLSLTHSALVIAFNKPSITQSPPRGAVRHCNCESKPTSLELATATRSRSLQNPPTPKSGACSRDPKWGELVSVLHR